MWGMALAFSLHADFTIRVDETTQRYTILDSGTPVLTYNDGIVPVPEGITGKYAVQRSNYIHPLYGPNGEVLTADYQKDHAHHRGIYWAWPEVTWKGEKRDLHALQGVFARPVRIVSKEVTSGCAVFEAENVWKWGDAEPVVRELAKISVSQEKDGRRMIDFELKFESLVDGLTLARRGQSHYGGFNIRTSAREKQKIATHTDPPETNQRKAWACLAGVPPNGKESVSVVVLQDTSNPEYPGDWIQFPNINWLQPTFPTKGTAFELKKGSPLVLKFRLVVCKGEADDAAMQKLCEEYNGAGK